MILINGQPTNLLSVQDRAFQYGDGVFETIAIKNGAPLCWRPHMERLTHGCTVLGIPAPPEPLLKEEADRLGRGQSRGVLKIILSRGGGSRGYGPPPDPQITRVVALHEWPAYPKSYWSDGVAAPICRTRLGHQPLLAGLKHLNRLEQVLARQELSGLDTPEGVVLDIAECVVEGTMSNLFLIHGRELLTADLRRCGVAGIIRALVLARGPEWNLVPVVRDLALADVYAADELFFTNSILGVWPVRRIGSRDYTPGHQSREISRCLEADHCILLP